jgi:hypothetical protein
LLLGLLGVLAELSELLFSLGLFEKKKKYTAGLLVFLLKLPAGQNEWSASRRARASLMGCRVFGY